MLLMEGRIASSWFLLLELRTFLVSGDRGGLIMGREKKLASGDDRIRFLREIGSCESEGFGEEGTVKDAVSVLDFGSGWLTSGNSVDFVIVSLGVQDNAETS
jgi:hypothetical protein